jgi:hypothetical protein
MRLRYYKLSLAKIIYFMLPAFFISCQTNKKDEEMFTNPLVTSSEYVFIPIKRIVFDYFDRGKWRFITQEIEYEDSSNMFSLSALWIFSYLPLEIIVLDNPNVNDPKTYAIDGSEGISLRSTKIFLPFTETVTSEDFDNQLPSCYAGEFRAIARIFSSLKYIGVPQSEKQNFESQILLRPWFSLGDILCLKIIR